jgi:biotin carboxyl carrier protein
MKLALTVNGAQKEIEIVAPAPEWRFRVDGVERRALVTEVEPGVYSILLDGRVYEASMDRAGQSLVVVVAGERFEVEVRDPRSWSRKSVAGSQGVARVSAPMPGKVVRLLVAAGDAVEAGQGLLVVEAMKMQNEIKSPRSGQVVSLTAREGATVAAGEPLATIG